jgi:hypothetical protein
MNIHASWSLGSSLIGPLITHKNIIRTGAFSPEITYLIKLYLNLKIFLTAMTT